MPRHIRGPERALALAALVLALAAAGCAKKGPPTGGPPDLEPPRIVSITPDSGAAGVGPRPHLTITFSEGMEPRSTGNAFDFSPPLEIEQRRWAGNTVTLVLKDTLKSERAYTLYVSSGARDRHGNALAQSRAVVFTTSATFPPGAIAGRLEAVGFRSPLAAIWCYAEGRAPDSTARDFDALGVVNLKDDFRIAGLSLGRWRLWGFADLNGNRSFEPAADLLVPLDTTIVLTAEHPVAEGIRLRMVNPRAPGRFAGSLVDSVSDRTGPARLIVTSVADTAKRVVWAVPENLSFDFQWEPGEYRVRAYRDIDGDRAWKRDTEPASEEVRVTIEPGADISGVVFVLRRPGSGTP